VLIHGFTDTWRTWELVLPALEAHFDVLAPTLIGHAGGPPLPDQFTDEDLIDALERSLDDAGIDTAHVAGNSLGGYAALRLAERGRARSVTALAPAGGWADDAFVQTAAFFRTMHDLILQAAPFADQAMATPEGRRQATQFTVVNFEHLPAELLAHQLRGAAATATLPMLEHSLAHGFQIDAARITCPVRIVWGDQDQILRWPSAAARFHEWLPSADWVELPGIGHCPQLDVPGQTAELITEWAGRSA
jgi:pimeloyl-ACP methyl ester carboxylesterase